MAEQKIDLADILRTLNRRRWLVAGFLAGCILLSLLMTSLTAPVYEADSTLRVKKGKGLGESLLTEMTGGVNSKEMMATYAEMLKSRTVVNRAIDLWWQQRVEQRTTPAEDGQKPSYESFVRRITTQPVRDTQILKVSVRGTSPEEAQMLTDLLVDNFIYRIAELSNEQQATVREFIGRRVQEVKADLDRAEVLLENYKRENNIVAPDAQAQTVLDTLKNLYDLKAGNVVDIAAAQGALAAANRQIEAEKIGFIADNALIAQYKAKLADLEVQKIALLQQYTENYPPVQELNETIKQVKGLLEAEAARVAAQDAPSANPVHVAVVQAKIMAEAQLQSALQQQAALQRIGDEREKSLRELPEKEYGYAKLERDRSITEGIYVMLAQRYEEARINEAMQPTDVQVVDRASLPERPVGPRWSLNLAVGLLMGLFFGAGVSLVIEYMNRTIRTPEDVEYYLGLSVLGNIPNHDTER
ncbi:MAG: GumC family protein [Negativicutes bacterium]|nr:GumC family protein [Negativicutes bacterium]